MNSKKIIRSAIWTKLHLNEEKIFILFQQADILRIGKISIRNLKKLIADIDGHERRDLSALAKKVMFTFEDVMLIFNHGKSID